MRRTLRNKVPCLDFSLDLERLTGDECVLLIRVCHLRTSCAATMGPKEKVPRDSSIISLR